MDYHIFKSALNRFYARYVGDKQRPTFFDIDATYPALNTLTNQYEIIKKEFEQVFATRSSMPEYHEIDPGEKAISNTTEKKWNVFLLYLLGHKPEANRALCPETCRFLDEIPGIMQAFFSILEPGKSIPLHEGPYLGYLRYHLGLHVPATNPPHIVVNSQKYVWKNSEAVLFDDSWPHAVVNQSEDYRAVLIVDVLRPMPRLPAWVNQFVTHVIARNTYGRKIIKNVSKYVPD